MSEPLTNRDGLPFADFELDHLWKVSRGDHQLDVGSSVIARFVSEVRRLRALTICDCGKPRLPGPCSGNCDNDE